MPYMSDTMKKRAAKQAHLDEKRTGRYNPQNGYRLPQLPVQSSPAGQAIGGVAGRMNNLFPTRFSGTGYRPIPLPSSSQPPRFDNGPMIVYGPQYGGGQAPDGKYGPSSPRIEDTGYRPMPLPAVNTPIRTPQQVPGFGEPQRPSGYPDVLRAMVNQARIAAQRSRPQQPPQSSDWGAPVL